MELPPHTDEIDQRLNVLPDTQQSSESFPCDGLDGGIDFFSVPGVNNNEQAGTPRQGSRGDHGIVGAGQDTPVTIIPASSPLTNTQVDAIGDNSTIR